MPSPLSGQVSVTGTAQALSASSVNVTAFTIKAPASNAASVYVGGPSVTTSTGFALDPGDSLDYQRQQENGQPTLQLNPSDFYVVGSGGVVTWLASP